MKEIMKRQNPVDDLFRRELAGYKVTPSAERRAAFMQEAGGIRSKGSRFVWWIIGAVVLIMVPLGVLVLTQRDHELPGIAPESKVSTQLPVSKPNAAVSIQLASNTPVAAVLNRPAPNTPAAAVLNRPAPNTPEAAVLNQADLNTPASAVAVTLPVTATNTNAARPANPGTAVAVSGTIPSPSAGKEVTDTLIIPSHSKHNEGNNSLSRKWNISLGASYSPEWMFNTLNGDKFANNFGLEGTFHFGPYSVRTGVGLSITTGWNEVLVQSNPYLGSYQALDSITFTWGQNYSLVPTYYTSSQNVYDTARQYTYTNIKKRYTYLQIPMVLGYDFWHNNWLSLGVRAGAVMSLLLNTETSSMTYDPGKDRIVTINNITPDRIHLNWQAIGGINVSFRLSGRFSIEVEPEVRYYFNSVYESSELTKKPWSVGIRTAFIIKF